MNRKQLIIILTMVLFPIAIYSKGFVELSGGINMLSMSDYNSSIDDANKTNQVAGYISKLEKISFSALPELSAGILYETKAGLFGFYLRNSALISYGNAGNVTWPDGTKVEILDRNFTVFYTSLGVRKYFMPGENDRINFYIGLDGGAYYSFNNTTDKSTYYYDGSLVYDLSEKWSSFLPGGCAEAGFDWRMTDFIGLNLRAGYRLGIGGVTVRTSSSSSLYNGLVYKRNVDYSGFYITAGTSLIFGNGTDNGMQRLEYEVKEGRPFSELAAQFYNDGVKMFESGRYDEAEKKFDDAKKLDPDSSQIDEYLRRISIIKAGGQDVSIDKKLEIADGLRDAGSITEALAAYKEILEKDPNNKQAVFYTEEFAKKAVEFRTAAEDAYGKGKLKKAAKDITTAAEYAPDDKEITVLKDKILKSVADKKETTRLFNEGVESFQKGDYGKAVEFWGKVLAISPGDEETKNNLKRAKDKLTQSGATAEQDIARTIKEAKDLFDKGFIEEAGNKYEYILRMDKSNTEAAEMIKKIEALEKESNDKDFLKKR